MHRSPGPWRAVPCGRLALTVATGLTLDGEFFTPEGAAPEPAERRVSLAGQWSLDPDDTVTFRMEGDTFVRFVEWQYGAGRLENEFTIGQYTTRTVLRR